MDQATIDFLTHETGALIGRAEDIRPFALSGPMPPAANISRHAQVATDQYFAANRATLLRRIARYQAWLASPAARAATAREGQRRFSVLRLRFNRVLTQMDLYSDALSQRGERDTGVWLAGLDVLAADAMALPGYFESPPLICYLDRGIGAAIRRARTRLPGGGKNPAAIIRVPRERMIGTAVASSLVHEVGHQGAALLNLVDALQDRLLRKITNLRAEDAGVWRWFERWISEIIADFWSIARLGVTSTLGLIGVVSLPSAFVFRVNQDGPHPFPWIRVMLSIAIGERLYPDPQWARLRGLWSRFYPMPSKTGNLGQLIRALFAQVPDFVDFLISARPPALSGKSLGQVMRPWERNPAQLRRTASSWLQDPRRIKRTSPSLAVATLGQARMDGALSPAGERRALRDLFDHWALERAIGPIEPDAIAQITPRLLPAS